MRAVATTKWRLGSGFSINRNNGSPSKPARRRTGERACDEGAGRGKRERGSVSCADEGSVTLTRSAKLGSARLGRGGESRGVHYQCFLRYSLKAITAR